MILEDYLQERNVLTSTRRQLVLALLEDGDWHSTSQIIHPAVGGSEGMRRLRELRQLGYPIEKQRHDGHDDWQYRLVSITEAIRSRSRCTKADHGAQTVAAPCPKCGFQWGR